MTFWIVLSWVCVAILTGVNIFTFIKLKKMSDQMMKMAFPGAKDTTDALGQMKGMLTQMQSSGALNKMGTGGEMVLNRKMRRTQAKMGGTSVAAPGATMQMPSQDQVKAAMDMLNKMKLPSSK